MTKTRSIIIIALTLIIGLIAGYYFRGGGVENNSSEIKPLAEKEKIIWTCSMHPEIKKNEPGKCPKCGMDLIPLKSSSGTENANASELTLTPAAQKLAEIQTFPVERKFIYSNIRMTGKVTMNEQLMAYITARMPGRIDKLFVNYTGIPVKKGDHMAEYYSPDLLVAQRELLLAIKDLKKKKDKDAYVGYGMSPEKMLKTVKKKLEFWGLTDQNIKKIIDTGKISQHIVLYAPVGGIVTEKNALEGKYFKTGDRLFTIADLSAIWVMLEAYESDLVKLRYGQKVEFTTEAYPGEKFTGRISFIDPVLDEKSRIVNVRVDAPNQKGRLKPGMFVRALVTSSMAADGEVVMDASLAGKWICPMHPEIIKDGFGKCDICEMDLVKAESLGYAPHIAESSEAPLIIPVTAPLKTGKRAIVYVKTAPGTFEGKEVVLGPRGEGFYIVKEGLKEGDLVVTNGNFKIDSALQILAKPSMMTPVGADSISARDIDNKSANIAKLQVPKEFTRTLDMIYSSYFKIQKVLSNDDFNGALEGVKKLKMMLGHISDKGLNEKSASKWRKIKTEIANIADNSLKAEHINKLRADFANLSAVMLQLSSTFGHSRKLKITQFHCPMAFDNKGANWLQNNDEIANPYFGQTMLKCGEKINMKNP